MSIEMPLRVGEFTLDIVEFVRARLDEREAWARAASHPYRYAIGDPAPPVEGVHWQWVAGGDWEPVTPDPVVDEFVGEQVDSNVNLATVERWPTKIFREMRKTYAGSIQEMDPSAAGHILANDPASVLRDIAAKRAVVDLCEKLARAAAIRCEPGSPLESMWTAYEEVAKQFAAIDSGHADYQKEWAP